MELYQRFVINSNSSEKRALVSYLGEDEISPRRSRAVKKIYLGNDAIYSFPRVRAMALHMLMPSSEVPSGQRETISR